MKAMIKKRYPLSDTQRKRTRVAIATVAVLSFGLLLLGFCGAQENSAETVSAADYLLASSRPELEDPLHLDGGTTGFELTGVSPDKTVIGYSSDDDVERAAVLFTNELQSDGWTVESSNAQGVLSFSKTDSSTGTSYGCLVQFLSLGQGCTLVVQRW